MHLDDIDSMTRRPPDPLDARFATLLAEVESAALSPVLPGETNGWARFVERALTAVSDARSLRDARRHEIDREIARRDPALCHRLTRMAERARRNDEALVGLRESLASIRRALDGGALESQERERARQLRRRLARWVVDVRVVDAELDTWFAESLYRDRGVVD